MSDDELGPMVESWLHDLAAISEPGPGVTRLPFTPQHRAALDLLGTRMEETGLSVLLDAAGTLIGRQGGPAGAPVLLMGSHQDSVRQGGAFDGIMGVVLPILALKGLRDEGVRLPFAVEVMAFADEEGVRFPTALMGPRALAGTFDMTALELTDRDGISLRQAMSDFGLDPDALPGLKRDPHDVLGWIECHIEQGPQLERAGAHLGVVTAICGIERHALRLTGEAGHAGTLPMGLRRDALAAAAEVVLSVEALARAIKGLLGTVGALSVTPNAVNAVPGSVDMTIELRAPDDGTRKAAGAAITDQVRQIAAARGVQADIRRSYAQAATPCDPALQDLLMQAVRESGEQGLRLASGATHDTSAMADLCPVALLFLACRDGISHNPAEHATPATLGRAVAALKVALQLMGARHGPAANPV